jgi:hypothetical protein
MFRPLLLFMCLLCTCACFGQDTTFSLHRFNEERIHITQTSMLVLGGWGAVNLGTGLIAMGQTSGQTKYFHQMNAIWGGVNLGIAAASYFARRKIKEDGLSGGDNWPGSVKEQYKIQTIYLVNGALDLTYIAGGIAMREYGKTKLFGTGYDRWRGFGTSFIVQGCVLLLYDGINYAIHQSHGKKLFKRFDLRIN